MAAPKLDAKRSSMAKENRAKVRMTVIHFETESENATLQENIKSIAQTLARALTPPARPASTLLPPLLNGAKRSSEPVIEEEENDDLESLEPDPFVTSTTPASPKNGSARQYRTPQPIEIDLLSGPMPLKAFLEKANPEGDVKRFLAIAYWLKEYRKIEEVSMDHAYTCYRHMGAGWNVPSDTAKPFRSMKTKTYGWMKAGSNRGFFAINHLGENEARKMIE